MKYNPKVVLAYFKECGLPEPTLEHRFHPERKWRFDFAFSQFKLAVEVQGGIFLPGRGHTSGLAIQKEHDKRNEAAAMGWRILYIEPKFLCTSDFTSLIKRALI